MFNGIADRWLWGFDADGWRLICRDPAMACLGVVPVGEGAAATIDDARWLADALAFDHDAPVGISPALDGARQPPIPKDPAAHPAIEPIYPFGQSFTKWHWDSLNTGYCAAADLRFNGSYVLRYDDEECAPDTDFTTRFRGREALVSLYAMAARQPDLLAEYLCLYRILEAADGTNGKAFIGANLARLAGYDFGDLSIVADDLADCSFVNAFEVYRERAQQELARLAATGIPNIPEHLYRIRNSLAHGKHQVLVGSHGDRFVEAGRALPIVKLLARIAIEP